MSTTIVSSPHTCLHRTHFGSPYRGSNTDSKDGGAATGSCTLGAHAGHLQRFCIPKYLGVYDKGLLSGAHGRVWPTQRASEGRVSRSSSCVL
jgi:hypothetical protein